MVTDNKTLAELLAKSTLELVKIPSVTNNETAIADQIERWANNLPSSGANAVLRRSNAIVLGEPDGNRPCVALVGHLDTVPPHDDSPKPGIDGDKLTGLGASDMKGGIAVMQALFERLDRDSLPFALILVLYDREEGPYDESGLQPLLDEFPFLKQIDLAIAMEPTENSLQLGCLGAMHARIVLSGRSAHSARPWEGKNAIHEAAPLLTRLRERQPKEVVMGGLTFRESMSVTLANGGRARNVIPDRFELNLNYRFAAPKDVATAIDEAKKTVLNIAEGAEVEFIDLAPPGPVPTDNRLLEQLRSLGNLDTRPKEAWTDVGRLAAHGIDAVNFGPGLGSQAHQAGEWASVEALGRAYEILERFLSTPLPAK